MEYSDVQSHCSLIRSGNEYEGEGMRVLEVDAECVTKESLLVWDRFFCALRSSALASWTAVDCNPCTCGETGVSVEVVEGAPSLPPS